jgi:NitT/TauT family transport system substrate-binding protein
MLRCFRPLVFLVAVAAVLTAAAPARAEDEVSVGVLNAISDAPLLIAERKGYFKDAGIAVTFVNFDSAALMIGPLGTGRLDVGGGAPAAGLYNALGRGIGIKIVADRGTDTPGYGFNPFLVRTDLVKSGKYKKIADLKGLKVASPAKGSTIDPTIAKLLASGGLKYDDVDHVYLGFADQVTALRSGAIDATVSIEPWGTIAVRNGVAVKIMGNDRFYPNQEIAVVLYGNQFAEKRPDVAKRFMVAYVRGLRYYHDALKNGKLAGPTAPEVMAILHDALKIDAGVLHQMTPNSVNPDGYVNVKSLQADYDAFKTLGLLTTTAPFTGAVDMQYVENAYKTLGPYKPAK